MGYIINEKKLKDQAAQLEHLKQTVKLLGNVIETQSRSYFTAFPCSWVMMEEKLRGINANVVPMCQ